LEKIPKPLNEEDVFNKYPTDYNECMNTVLMQEVTRYNAVLAVIDSSCKEMLKAINGFVVMSSEMEKTYKSMLNNQVPDCWQEFSYPNLKPLALWVADVLERMDFIQGWYDNGAPASFWMSGFFFPQAFLTGVRQNFARTNQLPVDTIDYDYHVKDDVKWGEITEKPERGCYVYGFFIEGAVWDDKRHMIAPPRPKELFSSMPTFWLEPIQNRQYDSMAFRKTTAADGIYQCPLYKVLTRAGTLLTTGHSTNYVMNMELPSDQEPDLWIRAGVAMFLALRYNMRD